MPAWLKFLSGAYDGPDRDVNDLKKNQENRRKKKKNGAPATLSASATHVWSRPEKVGRLGLHCESAVDDDIRRDAKSTQ